MCAAVELVGVMDLLWSHTPLGRAHSRSVVMTVMDFGGVGVGVHQLTVRMLMWIQPSGLGPQPPLRPFLTPHIRMTVCTVSALPHPHHRGADRR